MHVVSFDMGHKLCKKNSMGDLCRVDCSKDSVERIVQLISMQKPFILCNLIQDWPALTEWSLSYLKEKIGGNLISYVETDSSNLTAYQQILQMKAADFFEQVDRIANNEQNTQNLYLVISKIMSHFNRRSPTLSELLKDINIPHFIPYKRLWEINLWIGIGGNKSNLHFDPEENLLAVIQGSKKIILFSSDQTKLLYQNKKNKINLLHSMVNIFNFDDTQFPLMRKAKYYETEVKKGEALYLPSGWWHAVESSNELNIAVNLWWLIKCHRLLNFSSHVTKQIFAIKGKWLSVVFPRMLRV